MFVVYREIWVLSKFLGTLNQSILFVIICVEVEFLELGLMIVSLRGFDIYDGLVISKFVDLQFKNLSKNNFYQLRFSMS